MNDTIKNPLVRLFFYALLLIWGISVLYPLLWTLLDSLKNNEQFFTNKPWSDSGIPAAVEQLLLCVEQI